MRRVNLIIFLFLASLFCVKEITSLQLTSANYSYCIEDMSEDGQSKEECDDDNECDLLFSGLFSHEFKLLNSYNVFIKPKAFSPLKSPFNEIHIPPPELI